MSNRHPMTRRRFLRVSAGAALAGLAGRALAAPDTCTLSIGNYGMKDMPVEEAIKLIADAGFDGIEIAARPDWNSAPANMTPERRAAVRGLLIEKNLKLTALMEHLYPAKEDTQHQKDLERLRGVIALGHDLSPKAVPLLQTVLGPGEWGECRDRLRDRLADWVKVGEAGGAVIAIKPHRGEVLSRPEEAVWLIEQLDKTPWLQMVYDYSHFAFREMPMAETIRAALPYTSHIAVKDAVEEGGKVVFKLPGDGGTIDYAALLRQFYEGGYRSDVCCEVSGMVWNKPGYDPAVAARTCYACLSEAFARAGVPRPKR